MRVGLDIGGTKTAALVVDDSGAVTEQLLLPTGYGADAVIATAVFAVRQLAERLGVQPSDLDSIGVGVPGVVDADSGQVSHAVNLGLQDLALGSELSAQLGTQVYVENDVNAAAIAAFQMLAAPSSHSLAYLNLGTGLAAGLIVCGSLWRGSRGAAGEIGHLPVDPTGPQCACGQRGCLELMASGSAVARMWPSDDPRPVKALFEAAAAGESAALEVKAKLIENIAAAVRILVLTVDVDSVVIGGGLSAQGAVLLNDVQAVLIRWAATSPFLKSLDLASRVSLLPRQCPAAALGAALVGATSTSRVDRLVSI